MNLYIITQDYPFGNGEPFLETEIEYAAKQFRKITVVSTSRNMVQTRHVPDNVEVVKLSRTNNMIRCAAYAFCKFFSKEALIEFKNSRKLEYKPSTIELLKAWIITWMLEKRYQIYFQKLQNEKIMIYSYWLASGAYFAAKWKIRNPNVIAFSRTHRFEVRDSEGYLPFRKKIDQYLDVIFFISNYTQNDYNRIMEPLLDNLKRAEQAIARLGVTQQGSKIIEPPKTIDRFNIVTCSFLNYIKRLDLIVDALSLMPEDKKISWTHFGWGPEGEIIKKMCENKLPSNIKWSFAGMVPNQDLMVYYQENAVDLFINSSDNEGVPVSIMEAMSFGIPCIARDVGGNREIVIDNISGFLLPSEGSAKAIAEKIKFIYDLKQQRHQSYDELRNSTRNFFENNYNADKNYQAFYLRLMELMNEE